MSHASPIPLVALWLFAIGTPPPPAMAQTKAAFTVTSIAEKKIAHLPAGPLYWRIESFPTLAQAKAAEAPTSLAAEVAGKALLLFTLGTPGGSTPGGAAEIGPLSPPADAAEYLLRVNYERGPPGAATAVHTHPGFETFYVLSGGLSQKTSTGVLRVVEAGRSSTGAAPGTAMQVSSSGATDLSSFVMFVLDAAKPFSTPAKFK